MWRIIDTLEGRLKRGVAAGRQKVVGLGGGVFGGVALRRRESIADSVPVRWRIACARAQVTALGAGLLERMAAALRMTMRVISSRQ